MQRTTKSAEIWREIREKILRGALIREAAEEYGVSVASITMRASRERWGISEMRGREKGKQLALGDEIGREIAESVERRKSEVQRHRETMLVLSMASRRSLAEAIRKALGYLSGLSEEQLLKEHRALASFSNAAESLFGWRALAVVEGEAAVREVRAENGERDTRAVNLELIRCAPSELRRRAILAKEQAAQEAKVRVVEGTAGVEEVAGDQNVG